MLVSVLTLLAAVRRQQETSRLKACKFHASIIPKSSLLRDPACPGTTDQLKKNLL